MRVEGGTTVAVEGYLAQASILGGGTRKVLPFGGGGSSRHQVPSGRSGVRGRYRGAWARERRSRGSCQGPRDAITRGTPLLGSDVSYHMRLLTVEYRRRLSETAIIKGQTIILFIKCHVARCGACVTDAEALRTPDSERSLVPGNRPDSSTMFQARRQPSSFPVTTLPAYLPARPPHRPSELQWRISRGAQAHPS